MKKFILITLCLAMTVTGALSFIQVKEVEASWQKKAARAALKAAWAIVGKVSDKIYYVDSNYSFGETWDRTNSGTIGFNGNGGSEYGAEVSRTQEVVSTNHGIEMWAENCWSCTGNIAVVLEAPSGRKYINASIPSRGIKVAYDFQELGEYKLRYTATDKMNWTLHHGYYHAGDFYSGPGDCPPQDTCPNSYEQGTSINSSNLDSNISYRDVEGHRFVEPSQTHLEFEFQKEEKNKFRTFNEISKLFYDEELKREVALAKGFKFGDKLFLEDSISNIEYDVEENETYVGFENVDGNEGGFHFQGDLTNDYKIGQTIKLNFIIVPEVNNSEIFQTIDYVKEFNSKGTPKINKYKYKK